MGFFDWLFGDDDPAPVTLQSTTSSSIPSWISDPAQRAIGEAERLTGRPYQPYGAPRLMPFQPDTLDAFQTIRDRYGIGTLMSQGAYEVGLGAAQPVSGADLQRYINPYTTQVSDITARELTRRSEGQRLQDSAAATRASAFGGDRHAILEAERRRNLEQQVGDVYMRGQAGAFDTGLNAALAEKDRQRLGASGLGQLAAGTQSTAMQDILQRMGIGQLYQNQGQQSLDIAHQDFLKQQQYPYEQLNYLAGIIRGSPYPSSTYTTSQQPGTPQPGFFQTAAGLGIGALGAFGQFQQGQAQAKAVGNSPWGW